MEKNSEIQDVKYRVNVVRHEVINNDYAKYLIKIWVDPTNIVFHIQDRYSGIRNWQDNIKNELENQDAVPNYPGKKWFGNLDPQFLAQRGHSLEIFMTTFLGHPLVKKSKLVPVYFSNRAASEEDKLAVQELALYLENKKSR
jgi:hypothetical protein